jgi:hypothetical protein
VTAAGAALPEEPRRTAGAGTEAPARAATGLPVGTCTRALLGWPESVVDVVVVAPVERLTVRVTPTETIGWDVVEVLVAGELAPRWISVERLEVVA